MEEQTVAQLEESQGVILLDQTIDRTEVMTSDAFNELTADPTASIGVDHAFRTQWLIDNGYDVTPENMINVDLPGRPQDA